MTPFPGDSELARLMRGVDWSKTPLGAPAHWPEGLRSSLGLCLDSAFPIAIYWGPQLALLYNDAWRPILGDKHPWGLARPAREVWPEIWEAIDPVFAQVLATGKGVFNGDSLLAMNRFGYVEECYFDYTFNPIRSGDAVAGIFNVVVETTYRVIGARRARVQRDFAARLAPAKGIDDVIALAAASLGEARLDVPFALLYRVGADGRSARLARAVGVEPGGPASPLEVPLAGPGAWPLGEVARFPPLPCGPWPEPAREALVLPVSVSAAAVPAALLVTGVSPRRALDVDYRAFFESLAAHMATAMTSAEAFETERRRAEMLSELDQAKTAFFSNVSHEFRTPLTLMLGPVNDLLERGDSPERETLAVVQRNGQRLLKLVNTLLDFARIEAGRVQASYEQTDLARITADLASNFRSACERAGLRLEVDCPPASEPAYVDREMWEKIVLNLLSNAFKFTLHGGISVSLRREKHFELKVSDTGSGIPADELPRMFERFHRVEGARGRSHEGSGIGLALVHELVKLHGGSIGVDSEDGRGTTFTVRIPAGAAHLPAERVKAAREGASTSLRAGAYVDEALSWLPPAYAGAGPAPAKAGGKRILLADDNADLREYARRLLAEEYQVEAVADGNAALAAARAHPPDLIVSDVMMPGLDGFGLIRELRADPQLREVPVVLLSARAGEEARIEGLGRGADDYLTKPFSARELLVRVGALLRSAEIRREAAAALRESEERFRALANTAPVVLWMTDAGGQCTMLSRGWTELTGQAERDALGLGWTTPVHPDDREQAASIFLRANEKREPFSLDYRLRRADGEYRWAVDSGRPRFGAGGEFLGFIGSVTDVHERKLAEEGLREADRRKDEFIATLSHELRNPLAPLSNSLELLGLTGGAAQGEQIHAMMRRQVNHLVRLTDDLLEISRVTRGALELRRERVELAAVVRNAIETSDPLLRAGGRRLELDLPPEPLWLDGDAVRLAQILANLLNNSAKYTAAGGRIEVRARREGSSALITVRDDGAGIPAVELPRVFEMFSRGERSSGLGIGLALARRLAEMHGGSIAAASAGPGQGAEFSVRLPLAAQPAAAPAAAASEASPLAHTRVLVVDDNRDAAESLGMLLKFLGADVELAHGGRDALAAFDARRPSAVLLDIGMPEMDGYEVARAIRGRENGATHVPLIALTGWGQEEDLRRAREAGFDHHMIKPPDIGALRSLLGSVRAGPA